MFGRLMCLTVALLVAGAGARAQESASGGIAGQVLDATRAAIPGATVTVINAGTNAQRVATTDGEGRFTIPNLPSATYLVRVELQGFNTAELKDFVVRNGDIGSTLRVRVTARNNAGSRDATSARTGVVQAAGPSGVITLPSGERSIPVTSVPKDERLIVAQVVFSPAPVRSRHDPITVKVRVKDTRGFVVRDALVFVRATPRVTSGISSGSSPAARRRNSADARSAAPAPWYCATIALPNTSLASLGLTVGPRSRSTSSRGISVSRVKYGRIGSSGMLMILPNWLSADSATPI